MNRSPPGSSVHGILQARTLEWLAMPSSRDLSNAGIKPTSPVLQVDLLSEPPGKPQNTGVGSLSLLQGIFPDLPNPGIKPGSPALQVDSLLTELSGKPQIREVVYWSANCEICSLWYMEKIKDFNQAVN